MNLPALSIHGLTKTFGAVQALRGVDLDLARGEVHGLLGANGSGKSTLIKILSGIHAADTGTVTLDSEHLRLPVVAPQEHGIAVIHQDLGLVDGMTVLENLGVTASYGVRLLAPVHDGREALLWSSLFETVGVEIDLARYVRDLTPSERALVAIVRAMRTIRGSSQPTLFILDEPTAYLPTPEAKRVTDLMRSVAARGVAVLFVTHRMEEILTSTDAYTVLRDGAVVSSGRTSAASKDGLISAMLGRHVEQLSGINDCQTIPDSSPALTVSGLHGPRVEGVSFRAYPGEILGITGLSGMGQDELAYMISGAWSPDEGSVVVGTVEVAGAGPTKFIDSGAVFVPGDRQKYGLWAEGTAQENVTLPVLGRFFRAGRLRVADEQGFARTTLLAHGVTPPEPQLRLVHFSGGNQQKILMAKWLQLRPSLVLVAEPTQGVDAGARAAILTVLQELAQAGACVVICSSDHEQLAVVCTRVLVLRSGLISAELTRPGLTEDRLVAAAQHSVVPPVGTGPRSSG